MLKWLLQDTAPAANGALSPVSMNIDALRGGVALYLFEFECLLTWRFLRRTAAMFSIQIRAEARRERFARKVVEAAYCVASHREDRKCSFKASIVHFSSRMEKSVDKKF